VPTYHYDIYMKASEVRS